MAVPCQSPGFSLYSQKTEYYNKDQKVGLLYPHPLNVMSYNIIQCHAKLI